MTVARTECLDFAREVDLSQACIFLTDVGRFPVGAHCAVRGRLTQSLRYPSSTLGEPRQHPAPATGAP